MPEVIGQMLQHLKPSPLVAAVELKPILLILKTISGNKTSFGSFESSIDDEASDAANRN